MDRLIEDLQRQFRFCNIIEHHVSITLTTTHTTPHKTLTIEGNLVARVEHLQVAQVVQGLEQALLRAVDSKGREGYRVELCLASPLSVAHSLEDAEVVARVVGVTSPDQDLDSGIDHLGEGGEL